MPKKQASSKPVVSASPKRQETTARIEIIKGPHKGSSYKLVGAKVSLGRSKKNDIVLDLDEKCSRNQAVISFNKTHYIIKDTSGRTSLKVNEKVQLQSTLQDGDTIQFGSSILRFSFKSPVSYYKPHSAANNTQLIAKDQSPIRLKKKKNLHLYLESQLARIKNI